MDAEPARLIIEALKEEKIDLYVTFPEDPQSRSRKRRNKEPLAPLPLLSGRVTR